MQSIQQPTPIKMKTREIVRKKKRKNCNTDEEKQDFNILKELSAVQES